MSSKTTLIKNRIVTYKTDYSHVTSKLFGSLQKAKQPTAKKHSDQPFKTVRQSKQRIQQIGQEKYKIAMKHMLKFKEYEQQKKKKKLTEHLIVDKQCTFKPKVNNSYLHKNQSFKYMKSNYSSKISKSNINPEIKQGKSHIKQSALKQSENNKNKLEQNRGRFNKKSKPLNVADRLLQWQKNKNAKCMNKTVQFEVSKSRSKDSSYSNNSKRKPSASQTSSYDFLHHKKLTLNLSNILHQSQQKYHTNSSKYKYLSTHMTPKNDTTPMMSPQTGRSTTSLFYHKSNAITPKANTMALIIPKQYLDTDQQSDTINKTQRVYKKIDSRNSYGQRLLEKQNSRGEGSFYLRQARANIFKNYQKSELLIKDKQYTKKFSINNNNKIKI